MKKLLLALFLLTPIVSFAQMPDFPMSFWGNVTVDGVDAPVESVIRVYDEATTVGEIVVTESGIYGYTEPIKQKLILGEGSGLLTFTVESSTINGGDETGGISPITHTGFVSGGTVQKDLTFVVAEVSSGGGSSSSGGGGGGGSSRKKDVEPTELVLGEATTTLDANLTEEEMKIVLQKQIIVLLTKLVILLKAQLGV